MNQTYVTGQDLLNEAKLQLTNHIADLEHCVHSGREVKLPLLVADSQKGELVSLGGYELTIKKISSAATVPAVFLDHQAADKGRRELFPLPVPVALPAPAVRSDTEEKKRRSYWWLAAVLLLLLLLFCPLCGWQTWNYFHPTPPAQSKTTTPKPTTQFCQLTNAQLSILFHADVEKIPSFNYTQPNGCILKVHGDFQRPTGIPSAVAIMQRGNGKVSDKYIEYLEITWFNNPAYNDVIYQDQAGIRYSFIIVLPRVSLQQIKDTCNAILGLYRQYQPKGDRIPTGCYFYDEAHPKH